MNSTDLTTKYRYVCYDNPYQGHYKKVLCVCSAGLLRSPTAAEVLAQEYGYNTRSAGCIAIFALIPVSRELLLWANEVVCMTQEHKTILLKEFLEDIPELQSKIIVLDIPDNFSFRDVTLQNLILRNYREKTTKVA